MENKFKISSKFKPEGDQPNAIAQLTRGLKAGKKSQTLLGVTGSGKTFTIANVIEKVQKPTLVIAPNKTLAAQLAQEFRTFFPKNAVEYFVSYYDYYQPEAYIASTDTYIEKESQINEEIDRLRHAATAALMSRDDVIICASVSCIYGLGSPDYYRNSMLEIKIGAKMEREKIARILVDMQYARSDILARGKFRLTGSTLEVITPGREIVTRIDLENDVIQKIVEYDFLTGEKLATLEQTFIYPAKHFVVPEAIMESALGKIEKELERQKKYFREQGKILEAERIWRRTRQDLEMMREVGYCNGIENYSLYLTGRKSGEAPYTLMDYFAANNASHSNGGSRDFLTVIDESHVTVSQLNGMYNGDHSRKENLIDNGFRLPSAYDNRPLKFQEFEKKMAQTIFVSATPGKYEIEKSKNSPFSIREKVPEGRMREGASNNRPALFAKSSSLAKPFPSPVSSTGHPPATNAFRAGPLPKGEEAYCNGIVEQVIRPTGLIDPEIIIRSAKGQVKDVASEIEKTVKKKNRVLVTTLTKKMAEDLSDFLKESGVKAEYLHSGVDTLDRVRILEKLRRGEFDVLVGVNLLREGLDLPEVALVAILDADKEGFLRSETSLIQTIGRAARNVHGQVILYADQMTGSMKRAIAETNRRRALQTAYNKKHKITPKTIKKKISSIVDHEINPKIVQDFSQLETLEDIAGYVKLREREMKDAARNLEFERAAIIRDEIHELRKLQRK